MVEFRTFEVSEAKYAPPNTKFVTVQSPALGRRGDIVIYNYKAVTPNTPIVILLHGVYGSAWSWMYAGGVHQTYENLRAKRAISEFVLVMPSDGLVNDGSGYLNHADANYADWIVNDTIAAARRAVPNLSDISPVFLAGLSMGGYGALRLGLLNQETICAVSAHSAITNKDDFKTFTEFSPYMPSTEHKGNLDLIDIFNRQGDDCIPIRFDCGRDDPLFRSNRALASQVEPLGLPVHFESFEGGHDWLYWHENIAHSLRFFSSLAGR